jgi:hypothetical protein
VSEFNRVGTNSGHGHAWARPDGLKERCGGVALCRLCAHDFALVNRSMQKGADTTASFLIEAMLPQLLIALVKRAGGVGQEVRVPVADVDATGGFTLGMRVDQDTRDFFFTVNRKQ